MSNQELIEWLRANATMLKKTGSGNDEKVAHVLFALAGSLHAGSFDRMIEYVYRFVEGEIGTLTN